MPKPDNDLYCLTSTHVSVSFLLLPPSCAKTFYFFIQHFCYCFPFSAFSSTIQAVSIIHQSYFLSSHHITLTKGSWRVPILYMYNYVSASSKNLFSLFVGTIQSYLFPPVSSLFWNCSSLAFLDQDRLYTIGNWWREMYLQTIRLYFFENSLLPKIKVVWKKSNN